MYNWDFGVLLLLPRDVQTFGISGPQWKKKGCLEPYIKYVVTHNHKKYLIMF